MKCLRGISNPLKFFKVIINVSRGSVTLLTAIKLLRENNKKRKYPNYMISFKRMRQFLNKRVEYFSQK